MAFEGSAEEGWLGEKIGREAQGRTSLSAGGLMPVLPIVEKENGVIFPTCPCGQEGQALVV
jgi:hypothetical protein